MNPHRARPAGGRRSGLATTLLTVAIAAAGLFAVWTFISLVVLDPSKRFLLPPPWEVLATLGDATIMTPMLQALWRTATVALAGLALAFVIGTAWAVVMAQSRWAERILYPYAVILQTVPILALTPLIGIWFGYGIPARIVVAVIIAVFPVISTTFFGLTSGPTRAAHDLFTLARATRWQRLSRLEVPAAVPSVFTGLRSAAGLSVIGAIVGDFFFQQGAAGIGGLLRIYTLRLNMDALLTAVGLTALFGVVVFSVFAALEGWVVGRWYGRGRP
ncbi:ABC transporter permease subunit [Miniimonas arenae]|uniref:ABC transporter permease subunit n=1 Tax=Miniimonas arenae TaxID=676201 RepID=A0A5C5BBD7_9MICO|nr:ABC transporter permease subunit [Miniimonas arenae]TNU74850.1 ABC transporter permease subunit [Miniimonas arenae]